MSLKTVIRIRRDEQSWIIRKGKDIISFHQGLSRLFRELPKLILDKDRITSIQITVRRKRFFPEIEE